MKSTIIFLLVASIGLLYVVQGRSSSDKVLIDNDQIISVYQPFTFVFECEDFTFFDSIKITHSRYLQGFVLRTRSFSKEERSPKELWSRYTNKPKTVLGKSPAQNRSLKVMTSVIAIENFVAEQEGDPWLENVCGLEVSELDIPIKIESIVLQRNSQINLNVLIGLIPFLWLISILFFIFQKLQARLKTNQEALVDPASTSFNSSPTPPSGHVDKVANHFFNYEELDSRQEEWWDEIQECIAENFKNSDFSLEQLSKELNLRRQTVEDLFIAKVKMKFVEFLNSFRLYHAQKLIEESNLTDLAELAQRSGFKTKRQFSKQFNVKFNMTINKFIQNMENSK